jgi:alpha-glucosidase
VTDRTADAWWRGAAIYQVYVRSFADGNGDGVGDLAGLRSRLPYLADLGIEAIWVNPWYASPMADGGYDVADYRSIAPSFGTLAEAEKLIEEAHGWGIRVIIDIVPNHASIEHAWFRAALAGGPGCAERDLFWFRTGSGKDGAEPPNDWQSIFGGSAWTRVREPDGRPGQWYLHLFATEQPDFNWNHPAVRAEFEEVLRFWLDRGADGIRIDSAALLIKDADLCDAEHADRDGVHEIYRSWRRIVDTYPGERALIGEVWMPDHERFARYLRPDELHTAFNFEFLRCPWDATALRACVDSAIAAHAPVGAPASWVLSNHDVTRHVTRFGREITSFDFANRHHGEPVDLALGTRRARAALLLTLALPGAMYVYQGEELGLEEVEDLPDELRDDPMWHRTAGADPGRDGCRIPLPWSGDRPPFGFSPPDATATPWLPQPAHWAALTAQAQAADPGSMLSLYREALRRRKHEPALGDGSMQWLDAPAEVLAFSRPHGFACVVNFSSVPVKLPPHERVLLTSGPLADGNLPPDVAAWLRC